MKEIDLALAAVNACRATLQHDVFGSFQDAIKKFKTGVGGNTPGQSNRIAESIWTACKSRARDKRERDEVKKKINELNDALKDVIPVLIPFQEDINNLRKSLVELIIHREEALEGLADLPLNFPHNLTDLDTANGRIDELEIIGNLQLNSAMDEVEDWLKNHSAATKPPTFELDLDAALPKIAKPRDIVWDASFMKVLTALVGKKKFTMTSTGNHRISPKVDIEVKRFSTETLQPLIGRKLLNYLSQLGATAILEKEMKVKPEEESLIISTWQVSSPKAASTDVNEFKNSGDFDILRYCFNQKGGKKDIIVLAQDADIRKTLKAFKFPGVSVYELVGNSVVKAA